MYVYDFFISCLVASCQLAACSSHCAHGLRTSRSSCRRNCLSISLSVLGWHGSGGASCRDGRSHASSRHVRSSGKRNVTTTSLSTVSCLMAAPTAVHGLHFRMLSDINWLGLGRFWEAFGMFGQRATTLWSRSDFTVLLRMCCHFRWLVASVWL